MASINGQHKLLGQDKMTYLPQVYYFIDQYFLRPQIATPLHKLSLLYFAKEDNIRVYSHLKSFSQRHRSPSMLQAQYPRQNVIQKIKQMNSQINQGSKPNVQIDKVEAPQLKATPTLFPNSDSRSHHIRSSPAIGPIECTRILHYPLLQS